MQPDRSALMERMAIPIVSGDGFVTVEAIDSGVPGLILAGAARPQWWILVHAVSGLTVSRSATHRDPKVLIVLATTSASEYHAVP